jgi:hypothetical protein
MPVILATWEAEMGRIVVRGQSGKIVLVIPEQDGWEIWLKW